MQLSPLHNFWSDVFDFTPAEAAAAGAVELQSSKHWRLLPAGTSLQQHMGQLPKQVQQLLGQTAHDEQQQQQEQQAAVQPLTEHDWQAAVCTAGALCSLQDITEGCFAFLLFPPGQQGAVLQWLASQFPLPASSSNSSSLAGRRSSSSDSHCDAAGVTEIDDITLDECPGSQEQDTAAAAEAEAAQPAADGNAAKVAACQEQQEQHQAHQQQEQRQSLLLHTNEAAVPAEVLQQMAAAAGWSQAQLKQLAAGQAAAVKGDKHAKQRTCFIGVEVSCASVEQQAALSSSAAALSTLSCSSLQAAKLFRNLGTDG